MESQPNWWCNPFLPSQKNVSQFIMIIDLEMSQNPSPVEANVSFSPWSIPLTLLETVDFQKLFCSSLPMVIIGPWKHSPQYLPSLIKRASVPCNNNILPIIPLPPTARQISQSIYTIWNMTIPRDTEMWLIVSSSILYRAQIGNVFYGQYPFSWGHPSQTSFQSRRPKATLGRKKTIPTKEHRDPQEAAATNFLKIDFAENLPHNLASKFSYLVSLQIKTLLRID